MDDGETQPIVWRLTAYGLQLELYSNGRLKVCYDQTFQVRFDSGAGPRENTASLYGYVEFKPRPASGTQAMSPSARPTEMH